MFVSEKKRRVVVAAASLIVVMGAYPPWIQTRTLHASGGAGGVLEEAHVYGLIFSPPHPPWRKVSGDPTQLQPFNGQDVGKALRKRIGKGAAAWQGDDELTAEFLRLNPSLTQFQGYGFGICVMPPWDIFKQTQEAADEINRRYASLCDGTARARQYDLSGFLLPGGQIVPKYGPPAVGWQTRLDLVRLLVQCTLVFIVAVALCWMPPSRNERKRTNGRSGADE